MRNRTLHDALRDFALEVAALLQEAVKSGAEVAFELDEEPGTGGVLYRYRALTSEYIDARWEELRALPSCRPAAEALGSGAASYLRLRGVPGVDAEPALRSMLDRLYEEVTSFEFPEERFERVYSEVERTLYDGTHPAVVVAPLPGLQLDRDRVELGDGLALVVGDLLDAPPEAIWSDTRERTGEPYALCVLERDIRTDMPLPISEARIRFRRVITALRLFKPGAVSLSPFAWARADEGAWQSLALGSAGHLRGDPWTLAKDEETDLVELIDLLARSRHSGTISWALTRFEMGCERALDTEALSDYLLGLRALLDGLDDTGRASLPLRLAALCADEDDRRPLQRRVELAFALERFVIGGGTGEAYLDEIGSDSPRDLVMEMEDSLRALLRDVLCGYLDPELKHSADDILLRSSEPVEISASDTRRWPRQEQPMETEAWDLAPVSEVEESDSLEDDGPRATGHGPREEPVAVEESPAEERPELEYSPESGESEPEAYEPEEVDEDLASGVTPSADWGMDEDPESYSAPV
jgi:hypothetical protein